MRRLILLLFFVLSKTTFSQDLIEPVKWNFNAENKNDSILTLKFIAKIQSGWHVYSQFIKEEPPLKTLFVFDDERYVSANTILEGETVYKYDSIFEKKIRYFENIAEFTLDIKKNLAKKTLEKI